LTAWIECESCGRIDKPAHDFAYPVDMTENHAAIRVDPVREVQTRG